MTDRGAPPLRRWYHGKLERGVAEERLRQACMPGSYLVRESERRPGSFVLSFLSVTGAVNHFRSVTHRPRRGLSGLLTTLTAAHYILGLEII